jgi:hypothetical protein
MKSSVKPSFYFSAYPLKAIKEKTSAEIKPGSRYLKAVLSGKTKTGSPKQTRVFPMINPYHNQNRPHRYESDKLPVDIELTEKNWFHNYE